MEPLDSKKKKPKMDKLPSPYHIGENRARW